MNKLTRLALIIALVIVALMPLAAQENAEETTPAPLPLLAIQAAASGSFADNDAETFTLTLDGSPELIAVMNRESGLGAKVSIEALTEAWAAIEEAAAVGVLNTGDLSITVSLSAPIFDALAGSVSYTASVVSIKGADEVPATFDTATLFLRLDADFVAAALAVDAELGLPVGE